MKIAIFDWNSVSSRFYVIPTNSSLSSGIFSNFVSQNLSGWNHASFPDPIPTNRCYRIRCYRPLAPPGCCCASLGA
jgi:hypothetical protein